MTKDKKKTAEAYETVSEEKVLDEAKDVEKVTNKMIEKKTEEETRKKEKEKKEIIKKKEESEKVPERRLTRKEMQEAEEKRLLESWEPKTKLGKDVKNGKIKTLDEVIDSGQKILEEQVVDYLVPIQSDLISIGQAKGKFGGGKRRAWRQTQRKTEEGNVLTFSSMAVVGDEKGHVGIGVGKATETLPARDKAVRKAKLSLIKVQRTCAGFDCSCSEKHTIPFEVTGKSGSVRVTLIPAPQGTGLVVANELKKILKLAGIKDVYSKTFGKQRTTFNLAKACIEALNKTNRK